jgi:sulfur relay (sulfurtransferase) complex TusBCD TusD component (DsrE family)
LGIILYTHPSSSYFRFGMEIARAAVKLGYSVRMFAWADSVYSISTQNEESKALESLLVEQNRVSLDVCTTCCRSRGIAEDSVIPGAHLSGLHKIVEIVNDCDRTLAVVP